MAARDFSLIESDHVFFMDSATEAQADRESHLLELHQFFEEPRHLHWLDLGCSQGEFTSSLFCDWNWPPSHLSISLLEPVTDHRKVAVKTLSRFSGTPPREVLDLTQEVDASFDVILANHSCYYVEDAELTFKELKRVLRPDGLGIIAIAGQDNFLIQLWQQAFESLKKSLPYWIAEDFRSELEKSGLCFSEKSVPYEIRFADTIENRDRLLRFLLGEYWPKLDRHPLRLAFSPFSDGNNVCIQTQCQHFVFEGESRLTR